MKRVKVQIDPAHSRKLIAGDAIAIKVPKGAEAIEIRLATVPRDSFAKVIDVFFNGRPA
jgi:hypothetical protein